MLVEVWLVPQSAGVADEREGDSPSQSVDLALPEVFPRDQRSLGSHLFPEDSLRKSSGPGWENGCGTFLVLRETTDWLGDGVHATLPSPELLRASAVTPTVHPRGCLCVDSWASVWV